MSTNMTVCRHAQPHGQCCDCRKRDNCVTDLTYCQIFGHPETSSSQVQSKWQPYACSLRRISPKKKHTMIMFLRMSLQAVGRLLLRPTITPTAPRTTATTTTTTETTTPRRCELRTDVPLQLRTYSDAMISIQHYIHASKTKRFRTA